MHVLPFPYIETSRLLLTVPTPQMAQQRLEFALRNRVHLAKWEPIRTDDYYSLEHWQNTLATMVANFHADRSLHFVLLNPSNPNGPILGTCNFNNFVRGAFQACYLGYSVDAEHEGQGLMHEALSAAIEYVFGTIGMHRIMANYIPTNLRSGKLLRRLGFRVEGYAVEYLHIAGSWQDHVLTALTNTTWVQNKP